MRSTRRAATGRIVTFVTLGTLAAVGLVGAAGQSLAGAATTAIDTKTLPKSLHASVETQAFTDGNGALSLLVDPGTAYAYANFERDDYGSGPVSLEMTARGANVNPGAIAAAVIWAPPDCKGGNAPCVLSGAGTPANPGLHEAKGFPGYAEALYPPPPNGQGASQERVYKCVVNKDGPGSPPTGGAASDACKQGGKGVPMTAWAETIADEVRATGFSRAAGFDVPGLVTVGGSESGSEAKPEGDALHSTGYSVMNDISILGGQIRIKSVRSDADILATSATTTTLRSACTFSGLTVGGQSVEMKGGELPAGQLKPLLDAVEKATKIKVDIIPPPPSHDATVEGGKRVAQCSGLQVKLTDTRTDPLVPACLPASPNPQVPQCVPAFGNREELSFGFVNAQESVNNFAAFSDASSLVSGAAGDATASVDSGTGAVGGAATGGATSASSAVTPQPFGPVAGSTASGARAAGRTGNQSGGFRLVKDNLALIGSVAAGAAGGLGLCVWLLLGVVNSLSRGTRLRLPGL